LKKSLRIIYNYLSLSKITQGCLCQKSAVITGEVKICCLSLKYTASLLVLQLVSCVFAKVSMYTSYFLCICRYWLCVWLSLGYQCNTCLLIWPVVSQVRHYTPLGYSITRQYHVPL